MSVPWDSSVAAFPDHQAADVRAVGLEILVRDAVVADQGIGHHDNLFGIGGIRDDLLIADDRGVEDDFADFAAVRPEPCSVELLSGFQHQFLCGSDHIVKLLYTVFPL